MRNVAVPIVYKVLLFALQSCRGSLDISEDDCNFNWIVELSKNCHICWAAWVLQAACIKLIFLTDLRSSWLCLVCCLEELRLPGWQTWLPAKSKRWELAWLQFTHFYLSDGLCVLQSTVKSGNFRKALKVTEYPTECTELFSISGLVLISPLQLLLRLLLPFFLSFFLSLSGHYWRRRENKVIQTWYNDW